MTTKKNRHSVLVAALTMFCLQLFLSACTTTDSVQPEAYQKQISPGVGVLLMKPDIECSKVTASGMIEPNAVWTEQCRRSVEVAINQFMSEHRANPITYDPASVPRDKISRYRELSKLYDAVGVSMLNRFMIPTAKSKTDWTLGKGVQDIREDYDAEYALFVFLRDQYESGGRVAMRLAAAALGVMTTPATQYGFTSLVDLETGDVVWFNRLHSTAGDLRELEPARKAVDSLLKGSPFL